ncbi:MAG: dihydroneopterin aldolase [Candidatus Nanopelagicales bacterium]|nr:dihydroneopterin aldolase [Candidatus Nanopelagicales bacterium]
MDRITISGIRAWGHHGVLPDERREGQSFVVDIELGLDTRAAAAADDLSETVDYGSVAGSVVAVIQGEPVHLIETLASRVADACLGYPLASEVKVTVHKPQAPLGVEFTDVSVTIARGR